MRIDYFIQRTAIDSIEIEDIGKCVIEACNDKGAFYYLIIRTVDGFSNILEYGPIVPDIKTLPNSVICDYTKMEFTEGKIGKIVEKFLNDSRRQITQAREVDIEEALGNCRSLLEYIRRDDL